MSTMSSTSQPQDFSDLYTDLMNRARADASQTVSQTQAKRYINIGLQDMHIGIHNKVPWAERTGHIQTRAVYDTGTLTATIGSTTITGSGTAWNTADSYGVNNMRAGGKIKFASRTEVYSIASVSGDTAAVLDLAYQGATEAGMSYTYFEDEFDLASDFMRSVDANNLSDTTDIRLIGRQQFRRRVQNNTTYGTPSVATIFDTEFASSTTRVQRIQLFRAPNKRAVIPYRYVTTDLVIDSTGSRQLAFSADTDEPIVPYRYRHAIMLNGLYHWYRDRKDDNRWQAAFGEFNQIMAAIVAEHGVGEDRPQISTARHVYRSRARRPYRHGRGRRYTTGDAFDQMR
jgi:hypothetical protein